MPINFMRFIVQMSIDEFVRLRDFTDWHGLKVGQVYVDIKENGKWKAFEVVRKVNGEVTEVREFDLQLV